MSTNGTVWTCVKNGVAACGGNGDMIEVKAFDVIFLVNKDTKVLIAVGVATCDARKSRTGPFGERFPIHFNVDWNLKCLDISKSLGLFYSKGSNQVTPERLEGIRSLIRKAPAGSPVAPPSAPPVAAAETKPMAVPAAPAQDPPPPPSVCFCPHCGEEGNSGHNFCAKCGNRKE